MARAAMGELQQQHLMGALLFLAVESRERVLISG